MWMLFVHPKKKKTIFTIFLTSASISNMFTRASSSSPVLKITKNHACCVDTSGTILVYLQLCLKNSNWGRHAFFCSLTYSNQNLKTAPLVQVTSTGEEEALVNAHGELNWSEENCENCEQKSRGNGTTWGWVINYIIFIFGRTVS